MSCPVLRSRSGSPGPRLRALAAGRLVAVICVLAALTAVAACGASGAAPPVATSGVHAYMNCLFSYAKDHGATGAQKACRAQRPAGGVGSAVQAFASCLHQHGVVVPSQSPGTSVSDDLLYLNQLRTGTSAQQAAVSACLSTVT